VHSYTSFVIYLQHTLLAAALAAFPLQKAAQMSKSNREGNNRTITLKQKEYSD